MRLKKAMLNITISMLYQIVALICGLITPRLILRTFGSTYNGVVSSAAQFLNLVSILRLGIAGATRVELYKTLANYDTVGTSRIIKATENYMRKISLVIVFYAIALSLVYPLISNNDLPWYECTFIILIVSLNTFAEYFFGITYSTLLTSDQREYIQASIHIMTTILNTIMVAVLIRLGGSIFVVKLGSAIVYALLPICMGLYCRKHYKLIRNCEADETALKQRGAVAFHSIANIVHNNTDLVLLTIFMDAKIISVYTVYYLVVGKVKTIMSVFTTGMEAAFGNMWAKNEIETAKRNFRLYEFSMFTFVSIVFSCVGILIVPFIRVYTKGVTDTNYILYSFAILVTITEAMYCIRNPYLTLVQATGHYKETKNGAAVEAIINIAISIVLVNIVGLNGVIIGTLVANTFRTVQYAIYISRNIFHRSLLEVGKRMIWLMMCVGMIITATLPLSEFYGTLTGWGGWIIQALITFSISAAVTVIMALIFYKSDFMGMIKVAKSMLGRSKLRRA